MDFTPLERDILDWIAERVEEPALQRQCSAVEPVLREFTGCGFFTSLRVNAEVPRSHHDRTLGGPCIESPELEAGGGCVLFLENGYLDCLEVYAHGDVFPERIGSYKLC